MAKLLSSLNLTLFDNVTGRIRGIDSGLSRLSNRMERFAARQRAMGSSILPAASLKNLAIGYLGFQSLSASLDATVGGAMKFQSVMTEIAKKTTLSPAGLEKMRESIIR
ncbi:hypothetical protein L1787_17895, partial [Acuticoccus sp. M5D2P5]|uniref:hypothetical protein n=1 Tax=Acuticoccus kalidii TaxID=2910977 RepID=UPI001F240BC5